MRRSWLCSASRRGSTKKHGHAGNFRAGRKSTKLLDGICEPCYQSKPIWHGCLTTLYLLHTSLFVTPSSQ